MSEPLLGEIRLVGFNYAPQGWALCNGQLLPISQHQSLYSILGTTYGGDGTTTFALPDLRGRTPIHVDGSHPRGQKNGEESHQLQVSEMPSHTHTLNASDAGATQPGPTGNLLARSTLAGGAVYSTTSDAQDVSLGASAISHSGGGQGHNNMQPFLTLNFCIALQGQFPSRKK